MNYKPRLNAINTPSRLTRKQSRHNIYVANRKMKHAQRKARRLAQ